MIEKKLARPILIMTICLLTVCLIWRISLQNRFTLRIPYPEAGAPGTQPGGPVELIPEEEGILEFGTPVEKNGFVEVEIRPERPGEAGDVFFTVKKAETGDGEYHRLRVGRFGTIYDDTTGNYTGDTIVLFSQAVFFLGLAVLMFRYFLRSEGEALYSYYSIYTAGFSLFAGVTGAVLVYLQIRHLCSPDSFTMRSVFRGVSAASGYFMQLTSPLILLFSVLMIISNVELLRHERPRFQNLLGILASLLLLAGGALGLYLHAMDFSGSERQLMIHDTLVNLYCTAFVYFECVLAGAVICGLRAALHQPSMDRDYIIILGCRFRRDGTLTPLLRGRCDRAVSFWKKQREETGKEAVLIPSSGQGSDESMPEAEAMSRYLRTCGIPDHAILPENNSRNTYQNMAFSRELIEARQKDARVIYSTTNYHVFRSGVWASLAGLKAEGIGSRTKWWFWPNAFLRECVGLLANRVKQETVVLVILAAFFAGMTWLLGV